MSRPGIEHVTQVPRSGHSTDLAGQVHPLCAHEDTVHACANSLILEIMFRCSRSVQMLHNVKKNNVDLFEVHVHVSSFQIYVHVQLQINLKCTDARPHII